MSDRQTSLDEVGEVNDNSEDEFRSIRIGPRKLRLPTDWEVRPLDPEEGATSRVTDGAHHSPNQSEDGNYYYATVSDMSSDRIDYDGCGLIDSEQYNNLVEGDCKPRRGEVLFSKDGTVGLTTVFNDNVDVVLLSSIAMIDPVDDILNPHYLSQYLSSDFTEFQIQSLKSGTAIRRVVLMDIEKIEVPIPSLEEQRKIATVLHTVDQAIQKTGEIIEQAERLHTGLRRELVISGINHSNFQYMRVGPFEYEIPADWEIVPIDKACNNLDKDRIPVKKSKREDMQGSIPYYGASGIIDYVDDYLFDDDLILLAEDGENLRARNSPISFNITGKSWVNNHAHVLKPREGFNINYLVEYFERLNYEPFVTGSAQPKLTQANMGMLSVPKPPEEEQNEITSTLTSISEYKSKAEQNISELKRIKRGLMQDLLSGEVRTADADIDIPEEVAKYG